jgi:hypothetical protein
VTEFKDPLGIAGEILGKQAYSHAISLLFGFAEDPAAEILPDVHIASAGLIEFGSTICAITCYHVLTDFWALKKGEPRYTFQIGSFVGDPLERLRDSDEAFDLAILDVTDIAVEQLSNRDSEPAQPLKPVRWPNDPVKLNDFVIICGFPVGTREVSVEERMINSVAYSVIEHVLDVDESSFTVSFNKDGWVTIPTDEETPQEIKNADINGLSGSPVFSGMRNIEGSIGVIEFVGTVLSELPFGVSGVRVRSSRCVTDQGKIVR